MDCSKRGEPAPDDQNAAPVAQDVDVAPSNQLTPSEIESLQADLKQAMKESRKLTLQYLKDNPLQED